LKTVWRRIEMRDDVINEWVAGLVKAFYIAKKDAKVYYFKAPNFTYGLLIPISLFLAFSMAGAIDSRLIVSGLTSLVVLFGTTSIEAVAVVLEKQTGTFERLLTAPVSFFTLVLGKMLAGFSSV
jgi:ABC-2 type transport system permease protein